MTLVVIGVGNPDRGDDGAGPLAASTLRALLPAARVIDGLPDGTALLELWGSEDDVVLIDALRADAGLVPGSVASFDPLTDPLPTGLLAPSTHALGVADGIELARAVGRLPKTLAIWGIAGDSFDLGAGVSPAVAAGIERVVRAVARRARAAARATPSA